MADEWDNSARQSAEARHVPAECVHCLDFEHMLWQMRNRVGPYSPEATRALWEQMEKVANYKPPWQVERERENRELHEKAQQEVNDMCVNLMRAVIKYNKENNKQQ